MSSTKFTLAALAALFIGGVAFAEEPLTNASTGLLPDVIVNGHVISQNHVTLMGSNFTEEKAAPGAEAKAAARAELITQEVLAQAALKDGTDKLPSVADQLAFQQRAILSRAYLEQYFIKNPITDESLKAAYEFNRANGKITEYKVRHILVANAQGAVDLIDKLRKGEDFAALANRNTQDPGGQNNGGDLGWFRPDIFVDHNFSDAVVALKKGEYTKAPVRTRFGWHVIKVEDGPRPVAKPLPFEALDDASKQALRQKTAQLKLEALTAGLTASAKITGPGAVAGGGGARNSR